MGWLRRCSGVSRLGWDVYKRRRAASIPADSRTPETTRPHSTRQLSVKPCPIPQPAQLGLQQQPRETAAGFPQAPLPVWKAPRRPTRPVQPVAPSSCCDSCLSTQHDHHVDHRYQLRPPVSRSYLQPPSVVYFYCSVACWCYTSLSAVSPCLVPDCTNRKPEPYIHVTLLLVVSVSGKSVTQSGHSPTSPTVQAVVLK